MSLQLRDPVHGFLHLTDEEVRILNLNVLQRLRGIHQLAMQFLVFPGAVHTRFDHTIGVVHVADRMAKELGLSDEDRRLVRLAALLHDVGHGPFSHASEPLFDRFSDRSSLPGGLKEEKIHEVITGKIIRNDVGVLRCIGQDTAEQVAQLLASGYGEKVLHSIVSGPLDADKQDYLCRDSLFCGVNYGAFDIHQLQRSLASVALERDRQLMVKEDGVHAVEQYMLAKYYMTTMVYRHKVRLISDQMLVRAISLGIEKDENPFLRSLFSFKDTPGYFRDYLSWDDGGFVARFSEPKTHCGRLLELLRQRHLLKRVFRLAPGEFAAEVRERLAEVVKPGNELLRQSIERGCASKVGKTVGARIAPDHTIIHFYQTKSVRETSRNDEASILVRAGDGKPRNFEVASTLFGSINDKMSEEHVEVYAPVQWDGHTQRDKIVHMLRTELRDLITDRIRNYFKEKSS